MGSLNKRLLIYCFFITAIGIVIPWLYLTFLPSNTYVLSYEIPIYKLSSYNYTLFLSYILVFSYLFFTFYYPFLLVYFSPYFYPLKSARKITKGELYDLCSSLSYEMGIKTPRLYLSKRVEIYSFGSGPENSTIILNEDCQYLDKDNIKLLLLHEMSHIKNDLRKNTLKNIYKGKIGKYNLLSMIYPCILIWFLFELIRMLYTPYPYGFSGLEEFFNKLFPFIVALMSISSVQAIKIFMKIFTYSFTEPVSDISEFRSDLSAYIKIGNTKPFYDMFEFIRKKQVEEMLNDNLNKSKPIPLIKEVQLGYDNLLSKIVPEIKHYAWTEYFREKRVTSFNYRGKSDYPLDELRLEFIEFINEICNKNVVLKINTIYEKQLYMYLGKASLWSTYIESSTAIRDWLYEDINKIPIKQKNEITCQLAFNKKEFNARKVSEMIQVPIENVLVILLYLMLDDKIYVY